MEVFGIGPMELILILIVALMVFGPDKLPQIGAKLGRAMREMRKATRAISDEINSTREAIEGPARELAEPFKDVTDAAKAAGTIAAAARNPGQAMRDSFLREINPPPAAEVAAAAQDAGEANTIAPPGVAAAEEQAGLTAPGQLAAAEEQADLTVPQQLAESTAGAPVEPEVAEPEPARLAAPEEPLALPAPEAEPALPAPEQSLAAAPELPSPDSLPEQDEDSHADPGSHTVPPLTPEQ